MSDNITPQQLVEKIRQVFRSKDAAAFAALYTEDAVLRQGSEVYRGREAIQESYETFYRAFPDGESEFWNVMSCGEHFIYEGIFRGTNTGPLDSPEGDIPPTGRKVELPFAFIAQMSPEGLIAEDRTYLDSALQAKQLGLG